ncbi:cytochrome P450 [Brachybacterium sacelli]|uniref:Cytochrome P450 n=1 Tax=Brachybacterium sacelli TaxID=173364 RepID=A0ABS4WY54_9MICO|nr:cytochrome P450 [Brachybacterium sacelli]MBP2381078.1 cytochrome P450 [Brachybacterium sacelli]
MSTTKTCPITGATAEDPLPFPFEPPTAVAPPTEWAELRAQCPVAHVRTPQEDALLLTRYEDVKTLLSDPRFTRSPDDEETAKAGSSPGSGSSLNMVGEDHKRWRRLLSRSFTAKRMQAMRPHIRHLTDELIDDMVAGGSTADLRTALGFPLPVYVICDLLGVPAEDRDRFAHWSDHFLNLTRYEQADVEQAMRELDEYLTAHVQHKREQPGEDLLSELTVIADEDDGRLSQQELVDTGKGLLIAGHETTANMIGKMAAMLLTRRERWEQLVSDPGLVPAAVEETLRFDANLGFAMHRWVSQEVRVGETTIEPDTMVLSAIPAANRDESFFEHADEMDFSRSPNPHLTFGAGPHSCLGQSLARVELATVLSALLERLPTLELAVGEDELERREGLLVGGLEEVPVRW